MIERHGRIDVMINNAGIAPPPDSARFERAMANQLLRMQGRIDEMEPLCGLVNLTDDRFDRMIRTHLYGVFYGTRAALRHMTPKRSGSIINISSILGVQPAGGAPDYKPFDADVRSAITMRIGMGRMATAEEIAELVRFLAGPDSSYSTGEVYTASGGYE